MGETVKEAVLHCENITQRFSGLVAVSDVSMDVYTNEIVGVIGPNGAGKTTLFNDITGIYKPTEGKVFFGGEDITGMACHKITAKGMTRTFQNIRLFNNMMAIDNVLVGLHTATKAGIAESMLHLGRHRREEKESLARAEEVLQLTDLYEYRYHYADSLPYGLQRRLEIARALACHPKLILLDEPAAGMNEQETTDLLQFIRKLKSMGNTIILIEHDMRLVMNLCDRIYVLDHGTRIAEGTPDEVRKNPQVITAYLGEEV
ncbi:MAG: ABC transporter ATP-binding protein [Lachnospiraceae bacterium]|nr:ABC transporter ATP-binding protein [Lachnospiraceae bacterium]